MKKRMKAKAKVKRTKQKVRSFLLLQPHSSLTLDSSTPQEA